MPGHWRDGWLGRGQKDASRFDNSRVAIETFWTAHLRRSWLCIADSLYCPPILSLNPCHHPSSLHTEYYGTGVQPFLANLNSPHPAAMVWSMIWLFPLVTPYRVLNLSLVGRGPWGYGNRSVCGGGSFGGVDRYQVRRGSRFLFHNHSLARSWRRV